MRVKKKGIVEIDRRVWVECEKKHWWQKQQYKQKKVKMGIVKSEIDAMINYRVYTKSGKSFSCENTYKELLKKYNEA